MFDKDNDYNYTTEINGVKVIYSSTTRKGCNARNILNNDLRTLWISEKKVPQSIILDVTNVIKKPKIFFGEYIGFYCWHAYKTNPKEIELYYSQNNKKYYKVANFDLKLKPGVQIFKLDHEKVAELCDKVKYIKIVIQSTFGGVRTYLNQIFFFDKNNQHQENNENETDVKSANFSSNRVESTNNINTSNDVSSNNISYNDKMNKKQKKLIRILNTRNINHIMHKEDDIVLKTNSDYYNRPIFPQYEVHTKLSDFISNPTSPNKVISLSNFKTLSSTQKDDYQPNKYELSNSNYNDDYSQELDHHIKDMETKIHSMMIESDLYQYSKINEDNRSINEEKSNTQIINEEEETNLNEKVLVENENIKPNLIEEKINNLQTDITEIKTTMNKIIEGVNQNEIDINHNDSFIESKQIIPNNPIELDTNLNQKLEELSANIQNQIYQSFIQPSIEKFNTKMNNNISDIKKEIKKLYQCNCNDTSKLSESRSQSVINETNSNDTNLSDYETFSKIASTLYKKLKQKEKLLNEKLRLAKLD